MTRSRNRRRMATAVIAGLVLASCGGDDGGEVTEAESEAEATLTETGSELDLLFEDDLEDAGNGWGEGDTGGVTAEFTGSAYEVALLSGASAWTYADAGPIVLEDSATTVEVDDTEGPADRSYGVICRLARAGPIAYYALTVNGAEASFAIVRWNNADDDPEILAEGEDEMLADLGAEGPVEVTGTCVGEGDGEPVELALAVDGEEVADVTDDEGLAPGISGLAVAHLGGEGDEDPVFFTGFEVRGEELEDVLALEEDFSDQESGFGLLDDEFVTMTFVDGGLAFELRGQGSATLPIHSPLPAEGEITATIDGDLTGGFAGLCLGGDGGQYEFAIAPDGYASLGFYPQDPGEVELGDFALIEERDGAYSTTGVHEVTARWRSDEGGNDLAIEVDGTPIVITVDDDRIQGFTFASFCATVANASPDGTEVSLVYRDLVASGEG